MKNLSGKSYLLSSGLVMALVGCYIAFSPVHYLDSMHMERPEKSISLLSDLRGLGGTLLFMGVGVITSLFVASWQRPALVIATVFYASYILFRSLSLLLDGVPETAIFVAYFIELILALLGCLFCCKEFSGKQGLNVG